MKIANIEIPVKKKFSVDLSISRLPSNTPIDLVAHVYRAPKPGPTLLLVGGVHGDEVNGIEIVKRAEKMNLSSSITCGTVISVPLLNVYGFINYDRGFPDGKDVNRSFPGKQKGSLASRVAYNFTKNILPLADYVLDFHTGGASVYNYPQSRAYMHDEKSMQLAEEFGMPILIKSGLINNSLRKAAHNMNIPIVVFEGGESLRMDEFSISEGLKGIERVLIAKGMKAGKNEPVNNVVITSNTWMRANRSGMFRCLKHSGDRIVKGEILGTVSGPYGNFEIKVTAKKDGIIYGHNNNPVVNQGDAIFHIGYE